MKYLQYSRLKFLILLYQENFQKWYKFLVFRKRHFSEILFQLFSFSLSLSPFVTNSGITTFFFETPFVINTCNYYIDDQNVIYETQRNFNVVFVMFLNAWAHCSVQWMFSWPEVLKYSRGSRFPDTSQWCGYAVRISLLATARNKTVISNVRSVGVRLDETSYNLLETEC